MSGQQKRFYSPFYMVKRGKKAYAEYKAAGICIRCCKNRASKGHVHCDACLEDIRAETKLKREQARMLGICPRCYRNPIYEGEKSCLECKERDRKRKYKTRPDVMEKKNRRQSELAIECANKGICRYCHKKPVTPGYKSCLECRLKNTKKPKPGSIPSAERPSYGLCRFCCEPIIPGKRVCQKHYDIIIANMPKTANKKDHTWNKDEKVRYAKIRSKYQR